jgi:hypothetical protein
MIVALIVLASILGQSSMAWSTGTYNGFFILASSSFVLKYCSLCFSAQCFLATNRSSADSSPFIPRIRPSNQSHTADLGCCECFGSY